MLEPRMLRSIAVWVMGIWLATLTHAAAGVFEESVFRNARTAASLLDIQLLKMEIAWVRGFYSNSVDPAPSYFVEKYPLIRKTKVFVDYDYFGGDKIKVQAYVEDSASFEELSLDERISLLKQVHEAVTKTLTGIFIFNLIPGDPFVEPDYRTNIILALLLNDSSSDCRDVFLVSEGIVGQAAFKDGRYMFSKELYLELTNVSECWRSIGRNTVLYEGLE